MKDLKQAFEPGTRSVLQVVSGTSSLTPKWHSNPDTEIS